MQDILAQWTTFTGNVAGFIIVVYWILDTIRNWGGNPELKLLKGELERTNNHITKLIETLSTETERG